MTTSTTNTAARVTLEDAFYMVSTRGLTAEEFASKVRDLATLPQQQGGEQEAGECDTDEEMKDMALASIRALVSPLQYSAICEVFREHAALRSKQPAASEGDGPSPLDYDREAIIRMLEDYDARPFGAAYKTNLVREQIDKLRHATNTSKQAAGEAVDSTFAEWLASEMPAGTVIGDPTWWANRIARQYQVHCTPRHPADEGAVDDSMVERAADAYEAAAESEGFGRVEGSERVTHLRFIRAAIDAALQAGTP